MTDLEKLERCREHKRQYAARRRAQKREALAAAGIKPGRAGRPCKTIDKRGMSFSDDDFSVDGGEEGFDPVDQVDGLRDVLRAGSW